MNEEELRSAMRATALAREPKADAWTENQRRLHHTRRRSRAVLGAAGLTAAAGAVLALLLVGGVLPRDSSPAADRLDQAPERVDEAPARDDRPLTVGLSLFNEGPLAVTVGEPFAGVDSWQEHAFVVRNTSTETVHLNDPRFSRFVGDRELLLGLGCGYGIVDGVAAEGCRADYAPRSLAPGESLDLRMALFRDLPGMDPLHSGRYPAHADLAYRTGSPFTSPEDGGGASIASVSLAYTVRELLTGTDVRAGAPFSVSGVIPPGCVPGGVPQDNARCEIPGGLRVDVVEAELRGPVAEYASVSPGSDTGIAYGPHVAVTIRSEQQRNAPGLPFAAGSAQATDGDGAIGISGVCGRGWTREGARVTEDPCSAATPVTSFGPETDNSFGFSLHARVGDRSLEPGRYELVLPLDLNPSKDALRLVLVVTSAGSS